MKRSEFLKRLGLGIAAIPLAPQFIAATKESFDGKGASILMNDEAGVMADPTPKKWGVTKTMETFKETGDLVYSHYEENFVHGGWPLRVNDIISIESCDNEYLVTAISTGGIYGKLTATCIPFKEGPTVYITRDNNIIRYSNLKSEL